jgi:hypothetical protein
MIDLYILQTKPFSLLADHTDQATGEVSANLWGVEGVAWSVQQIPTAVNLGFLDRGQYFFIQVAANYPHEASGYHSRPTTSKKIS